MSDIVQDDTPAERRRQKVRAAIVDAAERVFSKEGEAGLSIRRLAEEIDYSPAAIYKYFGSKEELVDELKESFFERLMTKVDGASLILRPFRERACHSFAKYIETAIARPHHYAAAFSSSSERDAAAMPHGDAGAKPFDTTHKGRAFLVIAGLIEEGQANGTFRTNMNPHLAAKSLWASMHGVAMLMIQLPGFPVSLPTPDDDLSQADFIRFHTELMFSSLCETFPVNPASRSGT